MSYSDNIKYTVGKSGIYATFAAGHISTRETYENFNLENMEARRVEPVPDYPVTVVTHIFHLTFLHMHSSFQKLYLSNLSTETYNYLYLKCI